MFNGFVFACIQAARLHMVVYGVNKKASLKRHSISGSVSPKSARYRLTKRRPTLPSIRSKLKVAVDGADEDDEDGELSNANSRDSINETGLCWVNMQLLNHRYATEITACTDVLHVHL